MPRTARIALPSLVYHIISRGNIYEWIFNEATVVKPMWRLRSLTIRERDNKI